MVKALKAGNREKAVSQYLAGTARAQVHQPVPQGRAGPELRHGGAGAGAELVAGQERGRQLDPEDLRGHQPAARRHPASGQGRGQEGVERAGRCAAAPGPLPQGVSQLVERLDNGTEDVLVLLPGFEERAKALYADCAARG